jgi:hypothetical protein
VRRCGVVGAALLLLAITVGSTPASASSHLPIAEPAIYRTVGPGVFYPDRTDPLRTLAPSVQLAFACIRYHESRNHAHEPGGWYQFDGPTWSFIRLTLTFLPAKPELATLDQQSAAARYEWLRNARLGVQWAAESSKCPGVFYFS